VLARVNGAKATITKPGNYYFVANMYYAATTEPGAISTVAITVNAAGPVTINMRGFSLTGPSQQFLDGYYTNPVAISINSGNVTVKNGSIAGFYRKIPLRDRSGEPRVQRRFYHLCLVRWSQ